MSKHWQTVRRWVGSHRAPLSALLAGVLIGYTGPVAAPLVSALVVDSVAIEAAPEAIE